MRPEILDKPSCYLVHLEEMHTFIRPKIICMQKSFTPLFLLVILFSSVSAGNLSAMATETSTSQGFPLMLDGDDCYEAVLATEGTFTAPNPDYWYIYEPPVTGTYVFSTCDLGNTCDTRIYLYDHCIGLVPTELAEGTLAFNDDYCGTQSQITAVLVAGEEIFIRIGDLDTECAGESIGWSLTYAGLPSGCIDPYACNYSPLAIVSDGSCIYPGNPDCPSGPDLVLDETYFDGDIGAGWGTDFQLGTINADDWTNACYIDEGSLTGPGMRTIVRFGIKIWNLGDEDYHIGTAAENPFLQYDPCHGHTHYVDYGEYMLYDEFGNELPVGHKNGFAVMDLCGIGGYTGADMGISSGCYDVYGIGTGGQWIDVTDVPDGTYTFVARVNWENHPDVDGRVEVNLANNWASRCMEISRDIAGVISVEMLDDCAMFIDCLGEIWGTAEVDCEGNCNGWHHVGDLNEDTTRALDDVDLYVANILDNTIISDICNDANADGDIDVVDAALVLGCANEGTGYTHDVELCDLPLTMFNETDTVTFSIGAVNDAFNYLDIYSLNPTARILGAQFEMEGITIDSVQNLCTETFGFEFEITHTDDEVIALGQMEVPYQKHFEPIPTFRIFYTTTYPAEICIKRFVAAVNENFEEVVTALDENCVTIDLTGVQHYNPNPMQVKIQPNPFATTATFNFDNPLNKNFQLSLSDINGNTIRTYEVTSGNVSIDRADLAAGVYLYRLIGENGSQSGKFIIQ
jgi:hypothetical protein